MRRALIDTNIYVDWINDGLYEDVLFRRDGVTYLSGIVVMELYAGAFAERERRLIRRLVSTFARPGRIVIPAEALYEDAGHVLRNLQASEDYDLSVTRGLSNDVLIALSARAIGATVITQNERHFAAIRRIRPFRLAVAGQNQVRDLTEDS